MTNTELQTAKDAIAKKYNAIVHRLIDEGKLTGYYYTDNHNGVKPALVLVFDDVKHPLMPIKEHRWNEYKPLLCAT